MNTLRLLKKGSDIHIKESQKGSFTKYCNGKVTNECIQRGKNSPDPRIRKKATFAANARKWKHQMGGMMGYIPSPFIYNNNPQTLQEQSAMFSGAPHSEKIDYSELMEQQNKNATALSQKDQEAKKIESQRRADKVAKTQGLVNKIADFGEKMYQQARAIHANNKADKEAKQKEVASQQFMDSFQNLTEGMTADEKSKFLKGELQLTEDDLKMKQSQIASGLGDGSPAFGLLNGKLTYNGQALTPEYIALATKLLQSNQLQSNQLSSKKSGGQLKKKKRLIPKTSRPFGHISILDDTGIVSTKTLKLK